MSSKTKQFYEKNAGRWSAIKTNSFYHEKPFRIFEKLLKKGDRVIDIGCAYGIHAPLFLGIGRKLKYEGIDMAKSMVKIAETRYPQLSFKVADATEFKSKKKYDAFWSAATLMHIPMKDWPKLLSNIESNVKKRGIGYITLPTERPNPPSDTDQRHFELFTKESFKKIVDERGWKILKTGELEPIQNATAIWRWFIVKLP